MKSLILIVDDEARFRKSLQDILEGEGYRVITAKNGEEAIVRFISDRPDLVILDLIMPIMNGFKTCEELRKHAKTTPIIFLTGTDSDTDEVRALGLGGDDFIRKESDREVILARVRRALERRVGEISGDSEREIVKLGRVTVDFGKLVVYEDERIIATLTDTERRILQILLARRNEVVSREELLAILRGDNIAISGNMIYVHISHLRGKLGVAAGMLMNHKNAGYRFVR